MQLVEDVHVVFQLWGDVFFNNLFPFAYLSLAPFGTYSTVVVIYNGLVYMFES